MTPVKVFSCEFCEVFRNTYFVEYLQTVASESVTYQVYIFLSEARLEEEGEYENHLSINPECVDELFVLLKDDIIK